MEGYIKKEDRKTILFLADDMRLPSGIGVMTRELIVNNAHHYNFIHVGGAINHPEAGKVIDLSQSINEEVGLQDANVLLYPFNGYGEPDFIRFLIEKHNINAIVHFTDPRYWIWLYHMSAEIRQRVPIFYYHIWDDLPAPHYNRPYYESCDLLMGISKQSYNISKLVLGKDNYIDLDNQPTLDQIKTNLPKVSFVPHGINEKFFYPLDRQSEEVQTMRTRIFNGQNPKFVLFFNNRNIRRKMAPDAILAFKKFCESLPKEEVSQVRFVLHTSKVDENGTDLPAVINAVCPELKDHIIITDARISPQELNQLYSCCDVVINIGSNEGWGLSSTEALLTGRVLINNVTGGLQDQCRFEDEKGNWLNFTEDFATNHGGKYKKHGEWVYPVFPASISLQGSVPTPYIFDDRCSVADIVQAIKYWYDMDSAERTARGLKGREWALSDEASFTAVKMAYKFRQSVNTVLENWVAPPRFFLYNVEERVNKFKNKKSGISF